MQTSLMASDDAAVQCSVS